MLVGSENYQYKDSYLVVVHPFTYVVIGILGLVAITIFITWRKRKK
ncbi:LPXTG cell wall anchor domain-containing protein [Metabacillus fastidiosus]|uniref:LPXTG cell wall anchor domain-containing protein n=1 Tax=Metabacillus fastidiosus TaxID=1458 RepID=A0ABU6P558_9BACI|nr:LPXTG cell wall anchor domain-containing protein [Metabacillus fastidiosus]MED4404263.1 LPXTG cell wall anchor domain-containing protein [Metabacillus fastidiosus]MED4462072.1 LPXTG cell wall anchor domain-containing protein [Metabacillus fastidiosus]